MNPSLISVDKVNGEAFFSNSLGVFYQPGLITEVPDWKGGLSFGTMGKEAIDCSDNRFFYGIVGAAWLSCFPSPIFVRAGGRYFRLQRDSLSLEIQTAKEDAIEGLRLPSVCLVNASQDEISLMAERFPRARVYACPLQKSLAALGVLAGMRAFPPNRNLGLPCRFFAIDKCQTFDKTLPNNEYGIMAQEVGNGLPVFNAVRNSPEHDFYGSILSHKNMTESAICMCGKGYFNDTFADKSNAWRTLAQGCAVLDSSKKMLVRGTCDYDDEGQSVFFNFLKYYARLDWVFAYRPEQIPVGSLGEVCVVDSEKSQMLPEMKFREAIENGKWRTEVC